MRGLKIMLNILHMHDTVKQDTFLINIANSYGITYIALDCGSQNNNIIMNFKSAA